MKIIFLFFFLILFYFDSYGQNNALYIPVTINSPLFNKDTNNEFQVGVKINNYGLHFNFAGEIKRRILIFSIQQNTGNIKFDPLGFNKYYAQDEATHLIQTKPSEMLYCELGFGYNFKIEKQKLSLLSGIGQQFENYNRRYFIQLDWGNESHYINAGTSLRVNYTIVKNNSLFTLDPVIQGKVKIYKLRVVTQFGYSIALKKHEDYMKPILTIGLELII